MNSYCVDGVFYMFVTRCLYPEQSGDAKHRHVFQNSSIIKSTDKGRTWLAAGQRVTTPMFPGLRFGAPYFVWYGKDGAAAVHNADKYVYAVSNNGHFEDGDDYILGRVLKSCRISTPPTGNSIPAATACSRAIGPPTSTRPSQFWPIL